ncbi:hypothetical protein BJV78DRAFT_1216909 [Lactifluus subvellereus]|nr:hypothetical protein BJV78DRAFT_1216909 [Lactifluus subvellereus]
MAKAKWIIVVAPIFYAVATVSAQSCPEDRPTQLCCRTLAPFSSNQVVLKSACGVEGVDLDAFVVSFCEEVVPCDRIRVCCANVHSCSGGLNGPVGVNCIGAQ